MKKLIFIFISLPSILFGQIQVSDIDYQLPRDNYAKKGFIKSGEQEYFIEQGAEGTKVSLVQDNDLVFLHELNHRPTDSSLKTFYSYENSNSGLIYDGTILYELYWDYVYLIDIVSGELIEVIDLKPYDFRLHKDFYMGENFFHFRALGDDWNGYVRLDRNSGLIDTLVEDAIVVNSKRFSISTDSTRLNYHDLESNQIIEHAYQFSSINTLSSHNSDSNSELIITDEVGIHLLKNDGSIQTLDCTIPENSTLNYVSDNRLAFEINNGNEIIFSVLDLENCSIVHTTSLNIAFSGLQYFSVFSDEQLFNEYFIFGRPADWQNTGLFYLYDINANQAVLIDIPIDLPLLDQAVRYGDNLYFNTLNDVHYIGLIPQLYRLNLTSYETETINEHNIGETQSIVVGESQNDDELNVYFRIEDAASLMQIDDLEQSLDTIEEFNLYENFGIYYSIYADIWVDNKYIFTTSDGIYAMENNTTTKLLDINLNIGSSAYKRKGDFVYVLTGIDTACYVVKIDINDLTYSTSYLPGVEYLYYKRATSDNAIVNLNHNFLQTGSLGFYDLDLEAFITIESLGLPSGTPEYISGNNILYHTTSSNGYDWYLINTETQEITLTGITSGTWPDPYPDGLGGFYLDGWRYDSEVSFMYLNEEGNVTDIYTDFNYSLFYDGDKFDGEVKSLAFDAPDSIIIISVKEGEVRQKAIPDNDLLYYQNLFWYESDRVSFIEVNNGSSFDTYMFTFETEPQNITPSGRNERLVAVLEGESFSVLVYKSDQHLLSFEKYDYLTGEIEQITNLSSVRNNAIGSNILKIDESKYLISANDGIHGLEPWIYNMITGELMLLEDMNNGFGSSTIKDFTINPLNNDVYFSALKTETERQLFKVNHELIFTSEVIQEENFNIHVYPNPTSSYIKLDKDFEDVLIFSTDGKAVAHLINYKKDDDVTIERLPAGLYFLLGKSKNESTQTGAFVVENR